MTQSSWTGCVSRLVLIALFGLGGADPAQAATVQDLNLGDTLIATIASPGVDTVSARFSAVQGTVASISVKAGKGSTLSPTIALKEDSGAELPLGDALVLRGRTAQVRNFEIPASGTYLFEIGGLSGSGDFQAKTKGKFPKRYLLSGSFPAGAVQTFDVMPGSILKAILKAERGSGYEPTIDSVADEGNALALENLTARGSRASFRSALARAGGTVTLTAGGDGTGTFTTRVTVKTPRSRQTIDLSEPLEDTVLGTLAGRVTNGLTGDGIAGVPVSIDPPIQGVSIVTDGNGTYSQVLPIGTYTATFALNNFGTETRAVSLVAGQTATVDVVLDPDAPVIVDASISGDPVPGATLTATASYEILDGSTFQDISWTQTNSVTVTILAPSLETTDVTLPAEGAFRDELLTLVAEPAIGPDQLPPNVPLPEGVCIGGVNDGEDCEGDADCPPDGVCELEFPGGLQDRFQLVGVNNLVLEEAGLVTLQVTVSTSSGDYPATVEVHTQLPFKRTLGIRNVPIGIPVLLHGKTQASYDWTLGTPAGSTAALADGTSQDPYFTPDEEGLYTVGVSDLAAASTVTLEIYAGTWRGVIAGQDGDGRPVGDLDCTSSCHAPGTALDKFTPWAQSGHAEIFTDRLNLGNYSASSCFGCHTVGYDTEVDNGGIDDAPDYDALLASGLLTSGPGDNWTAMLMPVDEGGFPETAHLANIQCENCHGPQQSAAHGPAAPLGEPRVSLSSDTCAFCHGEPLRHARFQQWQLSAHANYELAIDEGEDGSCARCHTANGFLEWLPILLDDDPATDPTDDLPEPLPWTADETHPQTCVTCHDPHNPGTTTGVGTDVTVRVYGDTPPLIGGFQAFAVGNGAMCMTCHNSRRGLRNDATFAATKAEGDQTRAPHGSAQGDMLMGQNAYFIDVGVRGGHSLIEDTCVNCHMEQTPPPDLLAYNQGGTNHTFFASDTICSNCHGEFTADGVQAAIQAELDRLSQLLEEEYLALIETQVAVGNAIDIGPLTIDATNVALIEAIEFGESRGRQALSVTVGGEEPTGLQGLNSIDVVEPGVSCDVGVSDACIGGPNAGEACEELSDCLNQLFLISPDELLKAGWNWNLVNNDGSKGIHNRRFAEEALVTARNALLAPAP